MLETRWRGFQLTMILQLALARRKFQFKSKSALDLVGIETSLGNLLLASLSGYKVPHLDAPFGAPSCYTVDHDTFRGPPRNDYANDHP